MSMKGTSRVNNKGRDETRLKPHRRGMPQGQFIMHPKELLESAAWRALTLTDRKILDRLELEHMYHAGRENGRLKCTYDDFENWGIRRKSICESLAKLEALGLVEVTARGRKAAGEYHYPSQYRLTYVQGNEAATNEWALIKTAEQAKERIDAAMTRLEKQRVERRTKKIPK